MKANREKTAVELIANKLNFFLAAKMFKGKLCVNRFEKPTHGKNYSTSLNFNFTFRALLYYSGMFRAPDS